jgi:hypothetical protein
MLWTMFDPLATVTSWLLSNLVTQLEGDPDHALKTHLPSLCAGILFGLFLWVRVSKIKVRGAGALRSENGREYLLAEEQRGEQEVGGSDEVVGKGFGRSPC